MWEIWKRAGNTLIYGSIMYVLVNCCALCLKKESPGEAIRTAGVWQWLFYLPGGALISCRYRELSVSGAAFCAGTGALLFAARMDLKCCQVYRFVWWICGGAGLVLFWQRFSALGVRENLLYNLAQWGGFCLLQQCFFAGKYGRADCHAFCCCSLFFCAGGGGLREYFMHMFFSFSILGMVQLLRHNIDLKGNLKKPVPFIPYIGAAFLLLWMWNEFFSGVQPFHS